MEGPSLQVYYQHNPPPIADQSLSLPMGALPPPEPPRPPTHGCTQTCRSVHPTSTGHYQLWEVPVTVGTPGFALTLAAWLAVRVDIADLPAGVTLHGTAWLGGIGFTLSLFIAGLVFSDASHLDTAKLGILTAALIAGITGWGFLRGTRRTSRGTPVGEQTTTSSRHPVGHQRVRP